MYRLYRNTFLHIYIYTHTHLLVLFGCGCRDGPFDDVVRHDRSLCVCMYINVCVCVIMYVIHEDLKISSRR
jgi:hypothetical protein